MEVVGQYLEDVQHFVRQGGAVCQGASEDNQKIDTFWRFLTAKVFHWFENSMKKQGVDAIPPEEYNYNITRDDMKVRFKRQYVPEWALSVIRREWHKVQGQMFLYRGRFTPKMPIFTQPKTTLYLTEKNCAFHRRLRIVRIIIYKNLDNFYFILVAHEIVLCTS